MRPLTRLLDRWRDRGVLPSGADEATPVVRSRRRRIWRRVLLTILAILLLYYPVGMLLVHRIDDDPGFTPGDVEAGQSRAVALAAALVLREIDDHRWTANDPFFLPPAALDNMPNFQQGIVAALSRFAIEMVDHIGRSRGSSQADPDLDSARGLLNYSGTVWVFDLSVSWLPTASSVRQYRAAVRHLEDYNARLARGEAEFARRADNLLMTLDRVTADLGSASAVISSHIAQEAGSLFDFRADDIFYFTKGRLYAYYLLMRELRQDFAGVIAEKELDSVWQNSLDSLLAAAELDPLVVVNAGPDAWVRPNHLAAQGFYLLRARTQLKEITSILLN